METSSERVGCCKLFSRFLSIHWRSLVVFFWPMILSPIIIYNKTLDYRCLYIVAIMAMFWVTEALPLAITSLMPIVLYPIFGVLSTKDTCECYMNDTIMMFFGSLVVAIAIEHSGLHLRIALLIIKIIGCSHRRLTFGLFIVTMFISMWVSNTAATAMMIPIIETVLVELEMQGLGNMFDEEIVDGTTGESSKKPTRSTMAYYLVAAYASTIGGIGTLVGSGTNLTMSAILLNTFENVPPVNFALWSMYAVPVMLLMGVLTWIWLQIMYMGMFRPNSNDARAINIGDEGESVAKTVIRNRYKELGSITWQEFCVAVLFVILILLWFFRNPGFVMGWPEYITHLKVRDSTAAIFFTIALFILPARLDFLDSFSKDPSKRPKQTSPGLLTWKVIHDKMHWNMLFVLGGGFAISKGIMSSNLDDLIGEHLRGLRGLNELLILFLVCLFAENVTEFTANVAIATIVLPILVQLCIQIRIHPFYLVMPATMCFSFSFHLPVGTPPNAIASAMGLIRTSDFIVAGIGPSIITLLIVTCTFPTYGVYVFDLHEFPDWADEATLPPPID